MTRRVQKWTVIIFSAMLLLMIPLSAGIIPPTESSSVSLQQPEPLAIRELIKNRDAFRQGLEKKMLLPGGGISLGEPLTTNQILDLQSLSRFQSSYPVVKSEWNENTGRLHSLITSVPLGVVTPADIQQKVSQFLSANAYLLKVDPAALQTVKLYTLKPGSYSLVQQQAYKGLPVEKSYMIAVVRSNAIVKLKLNTYDGIEVPPTPTVSLDEAITIAKKQFAVPEQAPIERASLVIYPLGSGSKNFYLLSYRIQLPLTNDPLGHYLVFVDAQSGEIIAYENRIYYDEISGAVHGMVYPQDPEVEQQVEVPVEDEEVRIDAATTFTDENGNYRMGTDTTVIQISSHLRGQYVEVENVDQESAAHRAEYPQFPHNWNWVNDDRSDRQEESNMYYHVNQIHDFFTKGTPFDIHEMDYPIVATVEYDDQYCNAFSTGPSIAFGNSADCGNLALYSDIVYHEYTHSAVSEIIAIDFPYFGETGNLNEGWADYFACTVNNDPCQGESAFARMLGHSCLRRCDTDDTYPEDYTDEPHSGAQIVSGALWDIREVLGRDVTDDLVIMAIKLQPSSFSEFLENMVIADDDNGDVRDGTPHREVICTSFYNHGIINGLCYGFTEDPISIITNPKNGDSLSDDQINIEGTAYPSSGNSLIEYRVEYGQGDNPSVWTEICSSTTPVINSILCHNFDLSGLSEQSYTIRLAVHDTANKRNEMSIVIWKIDEKHGFPKRLDYWYIVSPTTVADINADGDKEIVFSSLDSSYFSNIVIVDHEGNALPNWPKRFEDYCRWSMGAVSVGDLDSSYPGLEVVFAETVLDSSICHTSMLYAYHADGTLVDGWPREVDSIYNTEFYATPVLLDIDFDNEVEVIYLGEDKRLHIFEKNGENFRYPQENGMVFEWPVNLEQGIHLTSFSPALGNIDEDNEAEIIFGYYAPSSINAHEFYLTAHNLDGSRVQGWPAYLGQSPIGETASTPIIGDVDNDGINEIIIQYPKNKMHVFENTGQTKNGWPTIISDSNFGYTLDGIASPSIVDINDDGKLEIFVAINEAYYGIINLWIYLLNHDGSVLSRWPASLRNTESFGDTTPILAEIDNDDTLDIVVNILSTPAVSAVSDGNVIRGYPKFIREWPLSIVAVDDLDNDGVNEIIEPACFAEPCVLHVFNTGGEKNPWPMWQQNPGHTGSYLGRCSDSIDNDNDNLIDYPDDPQCLNAMDNSEDRIIECYRNSHRGDLNSNGWVSVADIVLMLRAIVGLEPLPSNLCCIDIAPADSPDNSVNVGDMVLNLRQVVELDDLGYCNGPIISRCDNNICEGNEQNACPQDCD